jgi:hypothetical protein
MSKPKNQSNSMKIITPIFLGVLLFELGRGRRLDSATNSAVMVARTFNKLLS